MTRHPPPRRHTGPALAACGLLGVTALGLLTAHGITASAAVPRRVTVDGAIPGPPTAVTTNPVIATDCPRSVPGVSQSTRTVYRTLTGRTAVTTAYVAAPPRTVFATLTATATVTAERTVTATATQTVTVTTTAAPPAPTAGSTP